MLLYVCSMMMTGKITSLPSLVPAQADSNSLQEGSDKEEGQFDLELPPPKITWFQYAISSLEAVKSFLDRRGFSEEATTIASSMNKLTYCTFIVKASTQLGRPHLKTFSSYTILYSSLYSVYTCIEAS